MGETLHFYRQHALLHRQMLRCKSSITWPPCLAALPVRAKADLLRSSDNRGVVSLWFHFSSCACCAVSLDQDTFDRSETQEAIILDPLCVPESHLVDWTIKLLNDPSISVAWRLWPTSFSATLRLERCSSDRNAWSGPPKRVVLQTIRIGATPGTRSLNTRQGIEDDNDC